MAYSIEAYERRRLRLISRMVVGERVLDLGYAQLPNPFLQSTKITGVDLFRPKASCHYARQVVADVTDLSQVLDDQETFDSIIASELIEHIEEPYRFLRSLQARVAAGGVLILSTPNPLSWPVLLFEATVSKKRFYTNEHLYYFSPRWMLRMLERCGFSAVEMHPVGLWCPLPVWCPIALSYQVIYVARATGRSL